MVTYLGRLGTRTLPNAGIFPIILAIHLLGCSSSPSRQPVSQTIVGADVAPGVILTDVLEGGQPRHYWQYEVRPATGSVRMVKEQEIQNIYTQHIPETFQWPTGAIEACAKKPEANSPDRKYVARCMTSKKETEEFLVVDDKSGVTVCHWKPQDSRGIRGFAWSPNSRSIAVLNTSNHVGKSPLELLSALSGHPVPHDTVFLDIMDVQTRRVVEYVVRKDVVSSFTRILKWSE
jgi:hypothetical protein